MFSDHLHAAEGRLISLLSDDELGCHHLVIEELALGSIKQRDVVRGLLSNLTQFPTVTHPEFLHLVGRRRVGQGIERKRCQPSRVGCVSGRRATLDAGRAIESSRYGGWCTGLR